MFEHGTIMSMGLNIIKYIVHPTFTQSEQEQDGNRENAKKYIFVAQKVSGFLKLWPLQDLKNWG